MLPPLAFVYHGTTGGLGKYSHFLFDTMAGFFQQ
jgi:hypothetical protein